MLSKNFYFTGIGCSSDRLDPLRAFFPGMPEKTGSAFIIIRHLHPNYDILSQDIIQRFTALPARYIKNDALPEPDHIYLSYCTNNLRYSNGFLVPEKRPPKDGIKVLTTLCSARGRVDQVQTRIPASSTGEDAFTVAILIEEPITEENMNLACKIFAIDLNRNTIDSRSEGSQHQPRKYDP